MYDGGEAVDEGVFWSAGDADDAGMLACCG